ncbi:MAG TPA: LamG-like jellyroll fold domain-containing protein [Planctomycetota bacterium]
MRRAFGSGAILAGLLLLPALEASQAATLTVTSVSPPPGAALFAAPSEVLLQLSGAADAASVNTASVKLTRDGPDGTFGTADDVEIAPAGVALVGQQIRLDLTGIPLADGAYRIRASGNAPISAGRVGWWRFDESAGTTASDSSGAGHHGLLGGNPQWQPAGGRIGGALRFDGSGDFVIVPRTAALEPAGALTLSLWANIQSVSASFTDIVRKADGGSPGYLLRWYHFDDHLQFRLDRNLQPPVYAADPQTTSGYLNAWHHLAGTYDAAAGTSVLYVDGVPRATVTGQVGALEHTDDLYFMWSDHGGQLSLPGLLDDVRIYARALTPQEILTLAGGSSDAGVTEPGGAPLDGDGDGTAGGTFSSTFTLNASLPPAPGSLIAVPDTSGRIQLFWSDLSASELGYRVERSPDGVSFVEIAVLGPDAETYVDSRPPGTSFYRVRAFAGSGPGLYSGTASATPSMVVSGECGLLGLELALLLLLRRRRPS